MLFSRIKNCHHHDYKRPDFLEGVWSNLFFIAYPFYMVFNFTLRLELIYFGIIPFVNKP